MTVIKVLKKFFWGFSSKIRDLWKSKNWHFLLSRWHGFISEK